MLTIELTGVPELGEFECNICNRVYARRQWKQIYCRNCELWDDCSSCGEQFKIPEKKLRVALESPDAKRFCSVACVASLNHSIICEIHGAQEKSFRGRCLVCHQESVIKYHGFVDCDTHGPQEISFSGVCRICYSKSVFRFKSSCETHPEEEKQFRRVNGYECWSCIKEEFALLDQFDFRLPKSFYQSTYRSNPEDSSGQAAMEEDLVESGVEWLVYMKGYIKDDAWNPLVIGKTGSKLVQPSGTDIRFQYTGNQPGRAFLRESDLRWDATKILVIPCDSEQDALKLEMELAVSYSLFFS